MPRTNIVSRTGPQASPVQWCEPLGRRIRIDEIDTLGISSQTLAERCLDRGEYEVGADLAEYFLDEMTRINDALFDWLEVIVSYRIRRRSDHLLAAVGRETITAMRDFGPGDGDLTALLSACTAGNTESARSRLELMRVRVAAVHDQLVRWIQQLLANIAAEHGEDAVRDVVLETYDTVWGPRYTAWEQMTPLQRLQISVEGMRGHLSGPGHRGDVGIIEESDRYTMVLDPCGSCGVLRRGDPDSGRAPADPHGTTQPHPWSWNRIGIGWYAVHSPIVMEWLQMSQGRPPMRPLKDCDTSQACQWFIYKQPSATRPEHYVQMGFDVPDVA